ncbi:hypothetical protein CJJ07_002515 [Candidozyma auris]|nr:hypothetical protein CJJ07_002515 [[Candida] auris]QEL62918.1 hypothetical protein CJJ09_005100 [[Candida] auris]
MDSPEIDHGPEVFETSDVESEPGIKKVEEPNESIARDPLASAQDAAANYENSVISDELTFVDFSGNVSRNLANSGYNVQRLYESRQQKLSRIAFELEELEKDGKSSEITELGKVLEKLRKSESQEGGIELAVGELFQNIDAALKKPTTESESKKPDEVLQLEKRIAELEQLVGTAEEPPTSLRNAINNATRRVSVLYDHEFELDKVKEEIRSLSKEMENFATAKRVAQVASGSDGPVALQVDFEHKVAALYDRLPEFDKVNSTVPLMLNRLKSLHHVHSESGHAVECVSALDKMLSEMSLDMKKWDEAIDKVDKSITQQQAAFESNAVVFDKKMCALLERIKKQEAARR